MQGFRSNKQMWVRGHVIVYERSDDSAVSPFSSFLANCLPAFSPQDSVLDIGTGSGILALASHACGSRNIVAIEPDSEACQLANANFARNRVEESVQIVNASAEVFMSEDRHFDHVIFNPPTMPNTPGTPEYANCGGDDELRVFRLMLECAKPNIRAGGKCHVVLSSMVEIDRAMAECSSEGLALVVHASIYTPFRAFYYDIFDSSTLRALVDSGRACLDRASSKLGLQGYSEQLLYCRIMDARSMSDNNREESQS